MAPETSGHTTIEHHERPEFRRMVVRLVQFQDHLIRNLVAIPATRLDRSLMAGVGDQEVTCETGIAVYGEMLVPFEMDC